MYARRNNENFKIPYIVLYRETTNIENHRMRVSNVIRNSYEKRTRVSSEYQFSQMMNKNDL